MMASSFHRLIRREKPNFRRSASKLKLDAIVRSRDRTEDERRKDVKEFAAEWPCLWYP